MTEARPFSAKVVGRRVIQLGAMLRVRDNVLAKHGKDFGRGLAMEAGRGERVRANEPAADETGTRLGFTQRRCPFVESLELVIRLGGGRRNAYDFPSVDVPLSPLVVAAWLWKTSLFIIALLCFLL